MSSPNDRPATPPQPSCSPRPGTTRGCRRRPSEPTSSGFGASSPSWELPRRSPTARDTATRWSSTKARRRAITTRRPYPTRSAPMGRQGGHVSFRQVRDYMLFGDLLNSCCGDLEALAVTTVLHHDSMKDVLAFIAQHGLGRSDL